MWSPAPGEAIPFWGEIRWGKRGITCREFLCGAFCGGGIWPGASRSFFCALVCGCGGFVFFLMTSFMVLVLFFFWGRRWRGALSRGGECGVGRRVEHGSVALLAHP